MLPLQRELLIAGVVVGSITLGLLFSLLVLYLTQRSPITTSSFYEPTLRYSLSSYLETHKRMRVSFRNGMGRIAVNHSTSELSRYRLTSPQFQPRVEESGLP
jgi:hypothetical protein